MKIIIMLKNNKDDNNSADDDGENEDNINENMTNNTMTHLTSISLFSLDGCSHVSIGIDKGICYLECQISFFFIS